MTIRRKLYGVALCVLATAGVSTINPAPAAAWPWDPKVNVSGSTSTCVPNDGGWMWYEGDGESGWATKYGGIYFSFTLNKVPTYGSLVKLKWGKPGCEQVRYFVVSRPTYGNNAAVGNLG